MDCLNVVLRGISVRRFSVIGKALAIFALGLIFGLGLALYWTTSRASSPLTTGLPSEWKAANAQFDARVRARFPIGTLIPKFLSELNAEGFEPTWFEADRFYGVKRKEQDFPCVIVARIYWRAGQNGTVTAVRTHYGQEGCL